MTLAQLIAQHPEIAALKQNYPGIAAVLNAPTTIDNPTPQGTVPRSISLTDVFGVIASLPNGAAEMAKLQKLPDWAYNGGVAAMAERNETSITNWLTTISAVVGFESTTSQAMAVAKAQLLAATVPDPSWTATIAGPSLAASAGLGTVTAANVQAADTAAGAWPA